jgi:flagella basal body P-ring formation protein FlgA
MNAMISPLGRTLLLFAIAFAILAGAALLGAAPVADLASARSGSAGLTSRTLGREPAPFSRDEVLAELSRALVSHFNLEGELQIELLRPWTTPARVAGAWELKVYEFPSLPSSSMMVRARVFADGSQVSDVTFLLRAQLWRDAWVSRQPLTVGAGFEPSLLETRRVDLLRERDVLPAAVGDRTYVFARAVPAGRLLTWRDLSRRPLVKKGDLVDVSAADGLLVVTMKAVAMENGAQGDTVTVRNPESRKDFAAMVIDENRVQVRF